MGVHKTIMVNDLQKIIKKESIVNFIIILIIFLLLKTIYDDFDIIISIIFFNFTIFDFGLFLLLYFFLLEILRYFEYNVNEFIFFMFLLLSLICIVILAISISYVFFIKEFHDFLFKNDYFYIKLCYSFEYKKIYINNIVKEYLSNLPYAKTAFILKVWPNVFDYTWIKSSQILLQEIYNYTITNLVLAEYVYEHKEKFLEISKDITDSKSIFDIMFSMVKNTLLIGNFYQILFYTLPKIILKNFYADILHVYIRNYLMAQISPDFVVYINMTNLEIEDFCRLLATEMLKTWHPLHILKYIIYQ